MGETAVRERKGKERIWIKSGKREKRILTERRKAKKGKENEGNKRKRWGERIEATGRRKEATGSEKREKDRTAKY